MAFSQVCSKSSKPNLGSERQQLFIALKSQAFADWLVSDFADHSSGPALLQVCCRPSARFLLQISALCLYLVSGSIGQSFSPERGKKMRRLSGFGFLLLCGFLFGFSDPGKAQDNGYIRAEFAGEGVRVDGWLNDPVWQQAQVVDRFFQREPREGEPATEKTEVRVAMDEDNLYIGVMCYDSRPDAIIAKEMERDSDLERDDNFALVLDTFFDQRTGFLFATNPNGAKFDAQLGFGRERMNKNWDGIWDVRAKVTPQGWSAEFVIPFKSLRFKEGGEQQWGINFRRTIARKNEEDLWRAWRRNDGLLQLTKEGVLELPRPVKRGRHLEFMPYVTGGYEKGYPDYEYETGRTTKTGIDVKYGLSPTLTADFTVNTDFAQVESDQVRINLTRYNLYYPEKRDFFLESSANFDFGSPHRAMAFYSRRIGIGPDRRPVPIIAGGRVSGKAGKYDLGLLSIQTGKERDIPSTNYSVARIKRNILEQSYIGAIFTQKTPADEAPVNRVVGADFRLTTAHFLGDKNLSVAGYFMKSFTPGTAPRTHAFNFFVDYPNDLIDCFVAYSEVGDNFNPEVGFVRRAGLKGYGYSFRFMPRPPIPHIRKLHFVLREFANTDFSNVLDSKNSIFRPIGFETQSGDEFEFNVLRNFDYLKRPFSLFEDVVVSPGKYSVVGYETKLETNPSRLFSGEFGVRWGGFYSGKHRAMSLNTALRLSKYLTLSGGFEYTRARLPEGNFEAIQWQSRVRFAFNTHLTGFIFAQWNNEDDETTVNFRIRWIPRLGSDFYLVYNEIQDTGYTSWRPKHRVLLAKFTYWWSI